MLLLSFAYFFQNYFFFLNILSGILSEKVGPDLGPKCLQRLSVDDKSHRKHGEC